MAIYNNDEILKCKNCGNTTFIETEIFQVKILSDKSKISDIKRYKKEILSNGIMCSKCNTVMNNPFK